MWPQPWRRPTIAAARYVWKSIPVGSRWRKSRTIPMATEIAKRGARTRRIVVMAARAYIHERMASRVVAAAGARVPGWTWPAVAAAAVAVLHLPSFVHRLMDGDEAVYGTIAALMDQGGRLYADGGVDNKPPGVYWLYAATFDV